MRNAPVLGLAAALALTACGDDGAAPTEDELAGTWRATKIEFVSEANPALRVEAAALGYSLTLVLNAAGTYVLTLAEPGQAPFTQSGAWSASRDVLTLAWTGQFSGEMQFDMSLAGATLTLAGGHSDFDVNGDGQDEPAILNLTLVRQ